MANKPRADRLQKKREYLASLEKDIASLDSALKQKEGEAKATRQEIRRIEREQADEEITSHLTKLRSIIKKKRLTPEQVGQLLAGLENKADEIKSGGAPPAGEAA